VTKKEKNLNNTSAPPTVFPRSVSLLHSQLLYPSPSGAGGWGVGACSQPITPSLLLLPPHAFPLLQHESCPQAALLWAKSCFSMGSSTGHSSFKKYPPSLDFGLLQVLAGNYLLWHCIFHGLQGNICSGTWSTSSPFLYSFGVYNAVSLFFLSSSACMVCFLPFLKHFFPRHCYLGWGSQLCPSLGPLELDRIVWVYLNLLTEATLAVHHYHLAMCSHYKKVAASDCWIFCILGLFSFGWIFHWEWQFLHHYRLPAITHTTIKKTKIPNRLSLF